MAAAHTLLSEIISSGGTPQRLLGLITLLDECPETVLDALQSRRLQDGMLFLQACAKLPALGFPMLSRLLALAADTDEAFDEALPRNFQRELGRLLDGMAGEQAAQWQARQTRIDPRLATNALQISALYAQQKAYAHDYAETLRQLERLDELTEDVAAMTTATERMRTSDIPALVAAGQHLREERTRLETEATRLETEQLRLIPAVADQRQKHHQVQTATEKLAATHAQLTAEVQRLQSESQRLETEREQFVREQRELTLQIPALSSEQQRLAQVVETQRVTQRRLKLEVEQRDAECRQITNANHQLETTLQALTTTFTQQTATNQQQRAEQQRLAGENRRLEDENQRLTTESAQLQQALDTLLAQQQQLTQTRQQLQEQHQQQLERVLKPLQKEQEQFQEQLGVLEQMVAMLQNLEPTGSLSPEIMRLQRERSELQRLLVGKELEQRIVQLFRDLYQAIHGNSSPSRR